jgi:hypothetical protein
MLPLEKEARKNIYDVNGGEKPIKKILASFSRGNIFKMNFEV